MSIKLPSDLASVHLVFHVSLLKKCVGDLSVVVPIQSVDVQNNLSYEGILVKIVDYQFRRLRNKAFPLVKVEMERVETQESKDGTQPTDIFTIVMGPDHPGRVRLYGCRVTKSLLKQKTINSRSSSNITDELVKKILDELEERMEQRIQKKFNAQRDVFERDITMKIIAQLQHLNTILTLDPNMIGFNVHSFREAVSNQPINRPSIGSNNQGQSLFLDLLVVTICW
ncbi:putative uroporphyrinogen decarboxylase, chloroplastic-like [Capsicum annuum]|nr:putative uroporphyrinogen decarboxylase, chloroplastic-like [Capsicum annuum]